MRLRRHDASVLLGSVVKPSVRTASTRSPPHRHAVADVLRAALASGFSVRRFEELPPTDPPEGPPQEPTDEIGRWEDWLWTPLGLLPEAARAVRNNPAMTIWHFQLG